MDMPHTQIHIMYDSFQPPRTPLRTGLMYAVTMCPARNSMAHNAVEPPDTERVFILCLDLRAIIRGVPCAFLVKINNQPP